MYDKHKALISGDPVLPGTDGTPANWILFLFPLFVFSFCNTVIYRAMRGIMDLGGYVASGGPYEIAHPAPNWIWVFPVFINVMVISIFASMMLAKRFGDLT